MLIYGKHTISVLNKYLDKKYTPENQDNYLAYCKKKSNKELCIINNNIIKIFYVHKPKIDSNVSFFLSNFPPNILKKIDKKKLDSICSSRHHDGIAVEFKKGFHFPNIFSRNKPLKSWIEFIEIISKDKTKKLLLILDHIQDNHNLGAIIRSGEALGICGIILSVHASVLPDSIVHYISTGASLLIPIKLESNLSRSMKILKEMGYWIVSGDLDGEPVQTLPVDDRKWALIIGTEKSGIKVSLLKQSDYRIKIPLKGEIQSLNASVSAGIFLAYFAFIKDIFPLDK
jgi:23S rRNA (guanosine2251-2'-O)-methyltransferase